MLSYDLDVVIYSGYGIWMSDLFSWARDNNLTYIPGKEICFMDGNSESYTNEDGRWAAEDEFFDRIMTNKMVEDYINGCNLAYIMEVKK